LADELGNLIFLWICLCAELGRAPSDMLNKSQANIEERLDKGFGYRVTPRVRADTVNLLAV
jgi:hypothetical protein